MLDITAYLDESQIENPAQHLVLAGFFGTDEQWVGLATDWKLALGQRKSLHMKELRWNGEKAKRRVKPLLAKLGALPHKHSLTPVYAAVKISDYADLIVREPRYKETIILNGYVECLAALLHVLAFVLPGHARVKVICERQEHYKELAEHFFYVFRNQLARHPQFAYFNDIQFVPKGTTSLTEPSDFLSFAKAKNLDEKGSKKDLWCQSIFGSKGPDGIHGFLHTRKSAREMIQIVLRMSKLHRSAFTFPEIERFLKGSR